MNEFHQISDEETRAQMSAILEKMTPERRERFELLLLELRGEVDKPENWTRVEKPK